MFDAIAARPNYQFQNEQQHDNLDWFRQNVVNPANNATVADSANVLDKVFHTGKVDHLQVQDAKLGSKEWVAQTVASVAGLVPYVVAGRLMGAGSRVIAEGLGAEGTAFGRFAASEKLTNIAGAAAFDFAKDPQDNDKLTGWQSFEARTANAAGTAVTFHIMGGQFSPGATGLKLFGEKVALGGLGGGAGALVSTLGDRDWSADHVTDKVVHGVAGGAVLPGLVHLGVKGANLVDRSLNRGIPFERYLSEKGFSNNPELISQLKGDAGLVRVGAHSDQAKLEGNTIRPNTNVSDLQQQGELAHEAQHRILHISAESRFEDATKLIKEGNPKQAANDFVDILRDQERGAIDSQRRAQGLPPVEHPAKFDEQHEQLWASQAQKFVKSEGAYRPDTYLSHGSDGTNGEPLFTKKALFEKTADGLHKETFEKPQEVVIGDSADKVLAIARWMKVDDSGHVSYQRIKAANGLEIEWWENGKDIPVGNDVTEGQPTFRANRRDFGTTRDEIGRAVPFAKYYITETSQLPNETLVKGSVYNIFDASGYMSKHGLVHTIEQRSPVRTKDTPPNADVGDVILRYKPKDKPGESTGWSIWEHSKPYVLHLGGEDIGFKLSRVGNDGIQRRISDKGGVYTEYPEGMSISATLHGGELGVPGANGKLPTIDGIYSTYRAPDGKTIYTSEDGDHWVLTPNPAEKLMDLTRMWWRKENGEETAYHQDMGSAHTFVEEYGDKTKGQPAGYALDHPGKLTIGKSLPVDQIQVSPGWTRMASPEAITDIYHEPQPITIDMGNGVTSTLRTGRSIFTRDEKGQFRDTVELLDNNVRYTQFLKPRNTLAEPEVAEPRAMNRGIALGLFHSAEGLYKQHLKGIQWPQFAKDQPQFSNLRAGDSTSVDRLGLLSEPFSQVERKWGATIYSNSAGETLTIANGQMMLRRTGQQTLVLSEPVITEHYATPVETPFGFTNQIKVNANGWAEVQIVPNPDGSAAPAYTAVRVFPETVPLGMRNVTMAEQLKDGGWNVAFDKDDEDHRMPDSEFYGQFGNWEHL